MHLAHGHDDECSGVRGLKDRHVSAQRGSLGIWAARRERSLRASHTVGRLRGGWRMDVAHPRRTVV